MPIRAAIFDIGGVLTSSPVHAIRDYVVREGLDYTVVGPMIADPELAWSRWEKTEFGVDEFMRRFEAEARDRGVAISAAGVMEAAFTGMAVRQEMLAVVHFLKGRLRLGCITNNVARDEERERQFELDELFEVVIESSKAGLRKPDPRIYLMACEQLGVLPQEAVFLDDIGVNLKGARALGMATIKVDPSLTAIDELEALLGYDLPRPAAL